jgi:organic radical activating enzyme
MKKLRLLFTEKCNKKCEGCCNKDWNIEDLPICNSYSDYEEILITGGEPMLFVDELLLLIKNIREKSLYSKIYLYTAYVAELEKVLPYIDGVTITLHEQNDYLEFKNFLDRNIPSLYYWRHKSLRLHIFKGIEFKYITELFKVKSNIEWIKNCPLPQDEIFMRVK